MIKKTSKGYKVTSEKGKNLSKPNLTKAEAESVFVKSSILNTRVSNAETKRTPKE